MNSAPLDRSSQDSISAVSGLSANSTNSSSPSLIEKYIPPWKSPYIIGIAGCSGSGKTTVAQRIIEEINEPWTVLLSLDNFYRPLTPEESKAAFNNDHDLDHPNALDLDLLFQCVRSLKEGKKTEIPVYSFALHARTEEKIVIYGANVIIIEGIYALYQKELLDIIDTAIYVDTDLDVCYTRRLLRDVAERGRDVKGIIKQWDAFVKPNFERHVKPTMNSAHVIIPRGSDNTIAIDMIIRHIRKQLSIKSQQHIKKLVELGSVDKDLDYSKLFMLPTNNQLTGITTLLLDGNSSRDEFIFYFNRLAVLLINHALELVEYENVSDVVTPNGNIVPGDISVKLKSNIIGVNIIRSGDCFMRSLRKTIPECQIGKLLIQSDSTTGEPQLHTEKLPELHKHDKILLFDAQIITGAACIMAIKILVDHDILEKDIIMVTYLATEKGIRRIMNAFPNVQIVIGKMSKMKLNQIGNTSANGSEIDFQSSTTSASSSMGSMTNGGGLLESDDDWWMSNRFIDSLYFGTD